MNTFPAAGKKRPDVSDNIYIWYICDQYRKRRFLQKALGSNKEHPEGT